MFIRVSVFFSIDLLVLGVAAFIILSADGAVTNSGGVLIYSFWLQYASSNRL
jgi:hypothetical protein